MNINEVLSYELLNLGEVKVSVYHLLGIAIIVILSKVILWGLGRFFKRQTTKFHLDEGRAWAFYQIVKYVIIIIVVVLILDSIGVKITILLAGSAALLVGVGLGLQQTFNDFVSGIILLFEGTVSVGDIVEVGGIVGKVQKIDIRTSQIETRDSIVIIVPNSKLINDNVINWSHNRKETRFSLTVGVAYGSDVEKVKAILETTAIDHSQITDEPSPEARFVDFGDSALIFELLFLSSNMFRVELTKSELRFAIDRKFRQAGIVIPFPQRDLHLKTDQPKTTQNQGKFK